MRDKTYDGWIDWRVLWQRDRKAVVWGSRFSDYMELAELWWQSNPNPHGWNTSTRAKYAKGFKP